MLTDAEIVAAYSEGDFTLPHREFVIDAGRKIIAAYQAKLLAGVEIPRPDTHCWDEDTQQDCWSHSKDQLQQYAAAAAAQAREKALDDAERAVRARWPNTRYAEPIEQLKESK